jgi:hypothetical protein
MQMLSRRSGVQPLCLRSQQDVAAFDCEGEAAVGNAAAVAGSANSSIPICQASQAWRASRFWLASTNSARKIASSETVIVKKETGTDRTAERRGVRRH